MVTSQSDGWNLNEATEGDIETLMSWFPQHADIHIWGGPAFRYPFTRETFFKDVHWGRMASYLLNDPAGEVVAFGQLYERDQRAHLARLVVRPDRRGRGVGRRLVEQLMNTGGRLFRRDEFSLFVFRDNVPAYRCYLAMGFKVREYPPDMPHADVCYYLTRAAESEEN